MLINLICLFAGAVSGHATTPSCATANCHGSLKSMTVVHGPVRANGCDVCHAPAKNSEGNSIPRKGHPEISTPHGAKINTTCIICHDKIKHALSNPSSVVHQPLNEKGCVFCHDPHHSQHKSLLKEDPQTLCIGCHQTIHNTDLNAKFKHPALNEGKTCLNCHQPHAGPPHLLKDGEKGVCLACHTDMKAWLAANAVHHKPLEQGRCTACHAPHGSEQRALLKRPYTKDFYVRFDENQFQLCFGCHKSELATQVRSESATSFRNGPMNLHYVHLQQSNGRSCRACHEVHASSSPKLIHSWMPYLGQSVKFQFNPTPEGGSCTTACHKPREYNRAHEVSNDKVR